jgi:hypothetical protein
MTASADARTPPTAMAAPAVDQLFGPPLDSIASQSLFRKHKALPHPKTHTYANLRDIRSSRNPYTSAKENGVNGDAPSQPRGHHTLRHYPRRIGSGPDLPPTPPAHSRQSSASSRSFLPSSPTYVETPEQSTEDVQPKPPSTPRNQMSPPTPDVTPPSLPGRRSRSGRPAFTDRVPSKATTESRTESFKTAQENFPSDDEEEDGRSTLRPVLPSARASVVTVRQAMDAEKETRPVGLGLGLESSPGNLTPRSKKEFIAFDGEWGSASEVEQEWDDNLDRNVTVRKRRRPAQLNRSRGEVVEEALVSPTNATKALRSMTLPERILTFPSPKETPKERVDRADRAERPERPRISTAPSSSDSSTTTTTTDVRRFSGMSTKSTVSTIVEAILVDTPPQRRKTLRHIKKQSILRDSGSDLSPTSSAPTSVLLDDELRRRKTGGRPNGVRHESLASTGTLNSVSSKKARREIMRNGAIPVIIVPDRKSSVRSTSREPSLRSTSSRRSKRSQSLSSVPLSQLSRSKDLTPYFERPPRRSRAASESDGSTPGDQRTIDYPPIVPRRTSSLSAPTSRNPSRSNSRSGSMTSESVNAHNALQNHVQSQSKQKASRPKLEAPVVKVDESPALDGPGAALQPPDSSPQRLSVDKSRDASGRRSSAHNTPFSQASMELVGTPELSEAQAVNLYPHQKKNILVVDHSRRPSAMVTGDAKPETKPEKALPEIPPKSRFRKPSVRKAKPEAEGPVTPPQPQFRMEDVDSPLRNPREAPEPPTEPPAFKLIPATPSGMTPGVERQKNMGNYFEVLNEKPSRSMSLVRRAMSRRRHSEYGPSASKTPGFLQRTFSLTRSMRKDTGDNVRSKPPSVIGYDSDAPSDESRLHPNWRPASWHPHDDDCVRDCDDDDDDDEDDEEPTYRYPRVDNRPPPPRRSLSARMKRTFAILPLPREDSYPATDDEGPDRLTVRRTASGNLRIVKHRASLDSLRDREEPRPYTAPETSRKRHFWQGHSAAGGRLGRIIPAGLGSKISELDPRRLSERRREKRSRELRAQISGPKEVRDGVGDVIRGNNYRDAFIRPA